VSLGGGGSIVIAPRKDLYGRRVVLEQGTKRRYGIVVDSHFEDEQGPGHQRRLILVVEDEETHLPLMWEVPNAAVPADWDRFDHRVRFLAHDTSNDDLAALGLGGVGMADLLGLHVGR
jgi:hypothetical protein